MTRILVVDDDPDFGEITRLILQANGYDVQTAANARIGLELMRESPPDLVLLDVMMAGILDGIYVARTMREDPALCRIPIIMISSITSSPMADRFPTDEYLPIDTWISKPVQAEDLLRKVARLTGGKA
jgi:CheY-like chemotaxis protein